MAANRPRVTPERAAHLAGLCESADPDYYDADFIVTICAALPELLADLADERARVERMLAAAREMADNRIFVGTPDAKEGAEAVLYAVEEAAKETR